MVMYRRAGCVAVCHLIVACEYCGVPCFGCYRYRNRCVCKSKRGGAIVLHVVAAGSFAYSNPTIASSPLCHACHVAREVVRCSLSSFSCAVLCFAVLLPACLFHAILTPCDGWNRRVEKGAEATGIIRSIIRPGTTGVLWYGTGRERVSCLRRRSAISKGRAHTYLHTPSPPHSALPSPCLCLCLCPFLCVAFSHRSCTWTATTTTAGSARRLTSPTSTTSSGLASLRRPSLATPRATTTWTSSPSSSWPTVTWSRCCS